MSPFQFPRQVPNRIPRLVAAQVVILGSLAPLVDHSWPLGLLVLDFALRALIAPRMSPLATVARVIANRLPGGPGTPIAYAPKRFAATVGLVFFSAAWVLHLFPATVAIGQALAAVVVGLASLEAVFGFCLGCRIHGGLVRAGVLREPPCPTCEVPHRASHPTF
ncbi:MAG TPA: DUF4395 domain-containing protein [Myxococcota bacterium]|nr:DUF4395 domain-containing protein [Myxococcota bacterium]HQK51635.1 DUF4395 domain-containing protein [Myxococcota bacterium]